MKYISLLYVLLALVSCDKQNNNPNQDSTRSVRHLTSSTSTNDVDISEIIIGIWEDSNNQYWTYQFSDNGQLTVRLGEEILSIANYHITENDEYPQIQLTSEDITLDYTLSLHKIDENQLKFHREDIGKSVIFKWKKLR